MPKDDRHRKLAIACACFHDHPIIVEVLLNYSGGAYIYIRREYASRIRIIQRSWKTANKQAAEEFEEARAASA